MSSFFVGSSFNFICDDVSVYAIIKHLALHTKQRHPRNLYVVWRSLIRKSQTNTFPQLNSKSHHWECCTLQIVIFFFQFQVYKFIFSFLSLFISFNRCFNVCRCTRLFSLDIVTQLFIVSSYAFFLSVEQQLCSWMYSSFAYVHLCTVCCSHKGISTAQGIRSHLI